MKINRNSITRLAIVVVAMLCVATNAFCAANAYNTMLLRLSWGELAFTLDDALKISFEDGSIVVSDGWDWIALPADEVLGWQYSNRLMVDAPTPIGDSINRSVNVQIEPGCVSVLYAREEVVLYNLAGIIVDQCAVMSTEQLVTFAALSPDIYLLSVDGQILKICVR